MFNIEKEISLFLKVCGKPESYDKLVEYLNFTKNYIKPNNSMYCEIHHILPSSIFPNLKKDKTNLVTLTYPDHIYAHALLFEAYPTRQNQRTLSFMKHPLSKNSELIKKAAILGWKKLKKNKAKFNKFKEDRRKYMLSAPQEEHDLRGRSAWKTVRSSKEKYENFCKMAKLAWTDARKEKHSTMMKAWIKNNPGARSASSKKYWNSITEYELENRRKKVKHCLSDPKIRQKISNKLKEKWKDPEFKQKMKNRVPVLQKFELISPIGEKYIRSGVNNILLEFNLSASLFRKYVDTDEPVSSNYLKNKKVSNTIGWIFTKI